MIDDDRILKHMRDDSGPIGFNETCPNDTPEGWHDFVDSPVYQGLVAFDPRWEEWSMYIEELEWDEDVIPAVHSNFFGVFMSPDDDIRVCGWDDIPEAKMNIEQSINEGWKLEAFYDMIKKRLLDTSVEVIVHIDLHSNLDPHIIVHDAVEAVRPTGIKIVSDNTVATRGNVTMVYGDDSIIKPPTGPAEDIDVSDDDSSGGIIKL